MTTDYVRILQGAQPLADTDGGVFLSNKDPGTSRVVRLIDSIVRVFKTCLSSSPGYTIAAITGESCIDYTGKGGLGVGLYGVARGTGSIGSSAVHDLVGVHGTAFKDTNCWAAGVHADVYDTKQGGVGIGVNVEFPQTVEGNRYIGINVQGDANNPKAKYDGINMQGSVAAALNLQEATADTFLRLSSNSPMWTGWGSPHGGKGTYAGVIPVTIDGDNSYAIEIYKRS